LNAKPASDVTLKVLDENNSHAHARFTFATIAGRVYPSSQAPGSDFWFHPQFIARWRTIKLPDGAYTIEYTRGPDILLNDTPI